MSVLLLDDSYVPRVQPAAAEARLSVDIDLVRRHPGASTSVVCRQPVTLGVPFARGKCASPASLRLRGDRSGARPLQATTLEEWPDGSVRWALLSFQTDGSDSRYSLSDAADARASSPISSLQVTSLDGTVTVQTGAALFRMASDGAFPFADIRVAGRSVIDPAKSGLVAHDRAGRRCRMVVKDAAVEECGPVRVVVRLDGAIRRSGRLLLDVETRLEFFAGSSAVRMALTVRNPRAARHRGGIWELGDSGSISVKNLGLTFAMRPAPPARVVCSPELESPARTIAQPAVLYQDSSGGPQWQSENHVNHSGRVPTSFRGYRLHSADYRTAGDRATPYVALDADGSRIAVAVQYFWQNFPKAIEARDNTLTLQLFPGQYADAHEIQGGEQKTHRFVMTFGHDPLADAAADWGRSPELPRASVAQYCSGAVPYLSPADDGGDLGTYERLVRSAIEGHDTFEQKREAIDEYGWRHFGDIYADHEAVFAKGAGPLVSHYNNQYDAIAGSGYQFMRTGDPRWWVLMDELATHVADIDIYHTTRDKAAYNGGLFWHTFHYVAAGRSTHRSYPSADTVHGGGPAAEHSYAAGLRLHYLMTGDPQSKAAAVSLARWILAMDDGTRTPLRWLSTEPTGLASSTQSTEYHGPGRGPGHAILTLLEGHRLTGERAFLDKAEALIRRCIHPDDDVAARELLDAERRWSYTAFLEAVGRFLDGKIERDELDEMYAYGRASLLRYAGWMAAHEYPYLEKPEILEYPTETWVAQDMRKAEVFLLASRHTGGEERTTFLERARFFFRYAVSTLQEMPTRTAARPVVLLLSHGFMYTYFLSAAPKPAPVPRREVHEFGCAKTFIPQKSRALRTLRMIPRAPAVLGRFLLASLTE